MNANGRPVWERNVYHSVPQKPENKDKMVFLLVPSKDNPQVSMVEIVDEDTGVRRALLENWPNVKYAPIYSLESVFLVIEKDDKDVLLCINIEKYRGWRDTLAWEYFGKGKFTAPVGILEGEEGNLQSKRNSSIVFLPEEKGKVTALNLSNGSERMSSSFQSPQQIDLAAAPIVRGKIDNYQIIFWSVPSPKTSIYCASSKREQRFLGEIDGEILDPPFRAGGIWLFAGQNKSEGKTSLLIYNEVGEQKPHVVSLPIFPAAFFCDQSHKKTFFVVEPDKIKTYSYDINASDFCVYSPFRPSQSHFSEHTGESLPIIGYPCQPVTYHPSEQGDFWLVFTYSDKDGLNRVYSVSPDNGKLTKDSLKWCRTSVEKGRVICRPSYKSKDACIYCFAAEDLFRLDYIDGFDKKINIKDNYKTIDIFPLPNDRVLVIGVKVQVYNSNNEMISYQKQFMDDESIVGCSLDMDGNKAFFTTKSGKLYTVRFLANKIEDFRWRTDLNGKPIGKPLVGKQYVVVFTDQGMEIFANPNKEDPRSQLENLTNRFKFDPSFPSPDTLTTDDPQLKIDINTDYLFIPTNTDLLKIYEISFNQKTIKSYQEITLDPQFHSIRFDNNFLFLAQTEDISVFENQMEEKFNKKYTIPMPQQSGLVHLKGAITAISEDAFHKWLFLAFGKSLWAWDLRNEKYVDPVLHYSTRVDIENFFLLERDRKVYLYLACQDGTILCVTPK